MTQNTLASTSFSLAAAGEQAINDAINSVLQAATPKWSQTERRRDKRHPFPQLVTLTPISDTNLTVVGDSIDVVGKHITLRGFDFFHTEPLPYRRVIISFEDMPWDANLVLDVSWCRFLRRGWYDSGGRFRQIVQREFSQHARGT